MSRSPGSSIVTSLPPTCTLPEVGSSSPAMMRSSVDLPQPDGPTRTVNSPSSTYRSMPSSARTPSAYSLTMSVTRMSLMSSCLLGGGGRLLADAGGQPADEEALAGEVDEDHRENRDERPGEDQRLIGRVAALEQRQTRHQRAAVLVLEEHERDQQ